MRIAICYWLAMAGFLHAAGLTFEKELVEIHAPADAQSVIAEFKFQNKTDKPVSIAKYEKNCTCIEVKVSDGKLVYAPGEGGVIRAAFDMGNFAGQVNKAVVMWLDKDPDDKPSVALTVAVHIPVLVVLSEKTLKWKTDAEPETRKIDITIDYTKPIKILSANSSSENFNVEVKTLEEGKHYELLVTPINTKESGLTIIRIETDCDIKRHKVVQAFGVIRRDLPPVP